MREKLPSEHSQQEDLKVIEEEIHRINEIVDQFLRFAKPAPPLLQKAELPPILEETLQLLRPQWERWQSPLNHLRPHLQLNAKIF